MRLIKEVGVFFLRSQEWVNASTLRVGKIYRLNSNSNTGAEENVWQITTGCRFAERRKNLWYVQAIFYRVFQAALKTGLSGKISQTFYPWYVSRFIIDSMLFFKGGPPPTGVFCFSFMFGEFWWYRQFSSLQLHKQNNTEIEKLFVLVA